MRTRLHISNRNHKSLMNPNQYAPLHGNAMLENKMCMCFVKMCSKIAHARATDICRQECVLKTMSVSIHIINIPIIIVIIIILLNIIIIIIIIVLCKCLGARGAAIEMHSAVVVDYLENIYIYIYIYLIDGRIHSIYGRMHLICSQILVPRTVPCTRCRVHGVIFISGWLAGLVLEIERLLILS